jgi:hypothetical protein
MEHIAAVVEERLNHIEELDAVWDSSQLVGATK